MTPIIEAHDLRKRFGRTVALDGLDVVAEAGQVLAVLGPNGAGKTTFVRLIATLLRPDSGTLLVGGQDTSRHPEAVRRVIGLAGQYAAVEPTMTGRENLEMIAQLFGFGRRVAKAEATEVLETMGLTDAGNRLVRGYSGGMRRRLDLGASLVGSPRLLLLDEPTTGLDPRSRMELWDAIAGLVARGTDVLLTTQYLDEADHLASRIVIVDRGRVVADGTPAELKQRVGRNVIEVHVGDRHHLPQVAAILTRMRRPGDADPVTDEATRRVTTEVEVGMESLLSALRSLVDGGIQIEDIAVRQPKLDEVFLALTGQALESDDPASRVSAA